jgi:hypothetical protein
MSVRLDGQVGDLWKKYVAFFPRNYSQLLFSRKDGGHCSFFIVLQMHLHSSIHPPF